MTSSVLKYVPQSEFLTPERCYITELSNSDRDEACSVALARVRPGVTTQLHAIEASVERYVIVEGEGMVEIDGTAPECVRRFDIVHIPAGVSQRITNAAQEDLLLLCICTPRFKPAKYLDLESIAK
jgi:mannose-6-phosphate isomerase-like protein (cupin superfamily)